MIKFISFWSISDNKLVTCQLDSDGCEGTDKRIAKAINISLKKIDPLAGPKTKVHGLLTDTSRGETSFEYSRELSEIDRTMLSAEFFAVT